MIENLSSITRKARKVYQCNACLWLRECLIHNIHNFTFGEKRSIVLARKDNWKIQVGETHQHCTIKQDGELYSFRHKPDIDKIMRKYNLYTYD